MRKHWRTFLESFGHALYDGSGLWSAFRWGIRDLRESWKPKPPLSPSMERWSEIVTQTLRARGPALAEAITRNNPLLQRLSTGQTALGTTICAPDVMGKVFEVKTFNYVHTEAGFCFTHGHWLRTGGNGCPKCELTV